MLDPHTISVTGRGHDENNTNQFRFLKRHYKYLFDDVYHVYVKINYFDPG